MSHQGNINVDEAKMDTRDQLEDYDKDYWNAQEDDYKDRMEWQAERVDTDY